MPRRRPTWTDLALTAALVVVGLFGTSGAAQNQHATVPTSAYVLAVAACLPILGWRQWPLWTFVVTSGVTVLYLALGYPYGPILITLAVMIVGTALRLPVRRTLVAMGTLAVAMQAVIGVGVLRGTRDTVELLPAAAWLVVPAAVAVTVRVRRDAAIEVRAEQARRAVSEERLRLAREVHDVAGHGFAVIAMQAGVALRHCDRRPAWLTYPRSSRGSPPAGCRSPSNDAAAPTRTARTASRCRRRWTRPRTASSRRR